MAPSPESADKHDPNLPYRFRPFCRGAGVMLAISALHVGGATEGVDEHSTRDWSLSGSSRVGAIATWTTSNLDPQYGSATRRPADDDEFDEGLDLYALIDLRLHVPGGACLYVTTPLDEYGVASGVTVPSGWGEWDLHVCYAFPDTVWEDPYLLDQDRSETDRGRFGGTIGLNGIGGSCWSASYALRFIDVEKDCAGRDHPDLARDGLTHRLVLSTRFELGMGQMLCDYEYKRADLDGDAAAHDAATMTCAWVMPWQRCHMMLGAEVGYGRHRDHHPLFDSRREDLRLGANAIFTYRDPFGLEGSELGGLGAWTHQDSNCDFYDAQTFHLGGFIGYRF